MANKRFQGVLDGAIADKLSDGKVIVVHLSTTGNVIKGTPSIFKIGSNGEYDFRINYGNVSISTRMSNGNTVHHGAMVIDSSTVATTLPALLNATSPASDEVLLQMQSLLQDAQDAAQDAQNLADSFGTAANMDNQTGGNALRTAAGRDVVTSPVDITVGRALTVGYGGIGRILSDLQLSYDEPLPSGIYSFSHVATPSPGQGTRTVLNLVNNLNGGVQIAARSISNQLSFRSVSGDVFEPFVDLIHTGNTAVDGNGFVKSASPIVRLFAHHLEEHLEPQGAKLKKVGTGHYRISGTLGFAKEGWYIETPKDANGQIKFITEHTQEDDGTIIIKTYEPTGQGWRPEKGDPVDITEGRWIDLRLEPWPTEAPREDEEKV